MEDSSLAEDLGNQLVHRSQAMQLALPDSIKDTARPRYLYFKEFSMQPLAINLSLAVNPKMRGGDVSMAPNSWLAGVIMYALSAIGAVAGSIDAAPLRFDGKTIVNLTCTSSSLTSTLTQHYIQQGLTEVYKILGSIEILGNPVSLVGNLGDGVFSFFNEPMQGALKSPEDFVLGMGKGTSALVSSTLSGAFNALGSVTNSLGKGVAAMSMDDDFVAAQQRGRNQPEHLGDGLLAGGKSLATGIFAGVTGLVTDPLKGAKEDGAVGFIKGMGKGVVGLATKSTSGVVGLASNTLKGVGNTATFLLTDKHHNEQLRYRRAIAADQVLRCYDEAAAKREAARRQEEREKIFKALNSKNKS